MKNDYAVTAELVAVLVAVSGGQPRVLTRDCSHALPTGPFESSHRSLQAGLRAWVEAQPHHPIGYVERLYTFAAGDRANWQGQRILSLGCRRSAGRRGGQELGVGCRCGW